MTRAAAAIGPENRAAARLCDQSEPPPADRKGLWWLKQTGPLRQVKLRGLEKVDWLFVFSCAAHNLIRLTKLIAQPSAMLRE
jgi:hypothetical protein